MPFKLNPQTLEPENGDFIAFLKEIEKGGTRVQGLKVTMSQDNPGCWPWPGPWRPWQARD